MKTTEQPQKEAVMLSPEQLVAHWQGHRNLTRRVIEAFPEKEFFTFSIGGMRPFSIMVMELLGIAAPGLCEIATGKPATIDEEHPAVDLTKSQILELWDKTTEDINLYWEMLPIERFQETILAFGQYEGTVISSILYFVDNEIHHRGQGYVYLRSLGIEPPAFWER
ncbi:DinB family protein [Ulvibacter litoralis]|uniref:Uncharacterized damage-inducible protein DinB (Forms a four-helix bundle) n=1 Tax=Ulvibacter litoralis TaxID=227084 RepID=A0A1G7HPM4_9FLAO|nr:DinB family protein [Ulvibacter litoralis]GHC58564.1 DNA damage-inducible protein DinB [Ulvibacter litoralis]SDF02276.1 Uncharacterized damage-inducible protein DinB (forms a four-helix bundle) [Ulvibacter litoralis]